MRSICRGITSARHSDLWRKTSCSGKRACNSSQKSHAMEPRDHFTTPVYHVASMDATSLVLLAIEEFEPPVGGLSHLLVEMVRLLSATLSLSTPRDFGHCCLTGKRSTFLDADSLPPGP